MGVALWITAFDVNYARMDVEVDQRQGIRSFPATFGLKTTKGLSIALTLGWSICFLFAGLSDYTDLRDYRYPLWIPSVILMATVNLYVMTSHASKSESSSLDMEKFQQLLFKTSMLTGWVLLASLSFTEGMID
jgi:4-hydroxybenzoate polyprenyltransferase